MSLIKNGKWNKPATYIKPAGAELGQAQLKLEPELCYTSFEILSFRLLQLLVASGLLVISYTPSLIVLAE